MALNNDTVRISHFIKVSYISNKNKKHGLIYLRLCLQLNTNGYVVCNTCCREVCKLPLWPEVKVAYTYYDDVI